ncbi:MAG: PAS domain-containing protein, partial [Candidatus Competibacterales bacterium]
MTSNDTPPRPRDGVARPAAEYPRVALPLLQRALDASNTLVVIAEVQCPDQPLIFVNRGFVRFTGYDEAELLGRNCRLLQYRADGSRDDHQPGIDAIRHSIARGEGLRTVLRNYKKSGELFWNELFLSPVRDGGGQLTHYIGVQNDITARKRAEDALLASERLLSSFYHGAPVPMGILEERGGQWVHVSANAATAAFFATTPGALEGVALEALGYPQSAVERWRKAAVLSHRQGRPEGFRCRVTRGQQQRQLQVSVAPLAPGAGTKVRCSYVAEDITQRRRLEREILDVQGREQARMARDLHDGVTQQITTLSYMAQLAMQRLEARNAPEAADLQRMVALCQTAAAQARGLARSLYPADLSRGGFATALKQLVDNAQQAFGVTINCRADPNAALEGDGAHHLLCIAQEAVGNAVRHGRARRIDITLTQDQGVAMGRLVIADDGQGIDPGYLAPGGGNGG